MPGIPIELRGIRDLLFIIILFSDMENNNTAASMTSQANLDLQVLLDLAI